MTNKEKIIERLKLISKMKEGGEDGERANAAALMAEIMRRHGISEEDLDEEREEPFWLQVPDAMHYKLFVQMIALARESKGVRLRFIPELSEKNQRRIREGMKGTVPDNEEYNIIGFAKRSVFAEAFAGYIMYKDDFAKKLDLFYYAYLYRNDLLLSREGDEEEPSSEIVEDVIASMMMARNIKRAEVLRMLKGGDR